MPITPLSPEDPVVLGDFELLGRIGQGGMGQVFLGESLGGEPAAVKVIKPSVVDSQSRQRFAQEVEVLKTIWGPRIAAFLGADPEAEQPWLATEYIDGPDLARHVTEHGPLPVVLTAALGAILAEALAGVHTQGLLHRDLKPANILLGPNGPKIIDFGLAAFAESQVSLTAPGQVVGTPVCMAPEQAAGEKPLTPAVDVYALGTVLLYATTGHYPYQAATPYALFHLVTDPGTAPDLSDAPADLAPLLTDMLAHRAQDRPSLHEVVQRCRATVEAHGLKIAQARRRLTAHTARHHTPAAPTPAPTVPFTVPATEVAPAASTASTAPTAPTASTAQEPPPPADEAVPTPAHPAPPAADEAAASPAPVPAAPDASAHDTRAQHPAPDRPTTPPRPRKDTSRPLRHSLQARRTAERIRAAYAAGAPFAPSRST